MIKPYFSRQFINVPGIELRLLLFMEKSLSIHEGWFYPRGDKSRNEDFRSEPSFLEIRASRAKPIGIPSPSSDPAALPLMRPQRVNMREYFKHLGCTIVRIAPEDVDAVRESMKQRAHDEGGIYLEPSRQPGFGHALRNLLTAPTESSRGITYDPPVSSDSQNHTESVHDALARFGFYSGKPRYMN
jgi:hypothetical protein